MTTSTKPTVGRVESAAVALDAKDFKGKVNPDWCPGCGDFGVLNCVQRACADLGFRPHELLVVSGIGCSSNFPGFFNAYGMHTLHGRALAVATGAKMANEDLTVIVTGGDGDGYGIGGNHFTHTARRNIDLTYLVMDNQIYGLTTGQLSPTSREGMKTKSSPFGSVETPANPLLLSIMAGATFVARGFSADGKHLVDLIKQAIQHKGFSHIDIFSPCVTFNHENTFAFFRPRIKHLEDIGHDPSDWKAACERAMEWGDTIYTGVFYKTDEKRSLDDKEPVLEGEPLAHRPLGLSSEQAHKLLQRML
ncbi:MAG: 2-oxoacid:ferredoxin oxidoreductase subunit beta [Caldilineaceae bacterium]|nr:2-oxoacid:ferredoxin oxidoreductase subunit beta [Caldilineaceae bacterium]